IWTGLFAEGLPRAEDDKAAQMFNAACAAALAANGDGLDLAGLSDQDRARWRKQALDWMRAALTVWTRRIENGGPAGCVAIEKRLKFWQNDLDLVSLRDETALSRLPEPERKLFRQLWTDVAALRARAKARIPEQPKPEQPKAPGKESTKSGR